MPQSANLSSFSDALEILQQAIESPAGKKVSCASAGQAKNLRFRLYAARRAAQREAKKIYSPEDGRYGRSYYDDLIFTLDGSSILIRPGNTISYQMEDI